MANEKKNPSTPSKPVTVKAVKTLPHAWTHRGEEVEGGEEVEVFEHQVDRLVERGLIQPPK